jgi:hypothetical protein
MDDFSVYSDTFYEELENTEKVLIRCQETNLALSDAKCCMLQKVGIVLSPFISSAGIQVDTTKIEVILKLPVPKSLKDVRSFLGHAGYYRRFIEHLTKKSTPLFKLLTKDTDCFWDDHCQHAFEVL